MGPRAFDAWLPLPLFQWINSGHHSALLAGALVFIFFVLAFCKKGLQGGFIIFLAGITIFRLYYILSGTTGLSGDEAHYWEWSRRLAAGYYSKGPMIAYVIKGGTAIFGQNEFGVRFLAPVMMLLGSIVLFKLGSLLFDRETGMLAAIAYNIVPLFSAFGVLNTIDAPLLFFWILSIYCFYRAVTTGSIYEWLLAGIVFGLGLTDKLTMGFFAISAFLYLLSSREDRRALITAGPYAMLAMAALVCVPMVMWDAAHGWVMLKHNADHAYMDLSPAHIIFNFLLFAGSQAGVITPVLFALIIYALVKHRNDDNGFSFWFSVPVLAFFLVKSFTQKIQANWAMPGYVMALLPVSAAFLKGFKYSTRPRKALALGAVVLPVILSAVMLYPGVFRLPSRLDPTKRLHGWRQIAGAVDSLHVQTPYFVFTGDYQLSSELAFYMKGHPVTYCANIGGRRGRRMNQYDLWPGFEGFTHYNAVFVTIADSPPAQVATAFRSCAKRWAEMVRNGKTYSIFVCRDFKGMRKGKGGFNGF
ncbi:MAG: glycosyltransferase family 39 protein [Nitrospiraceae bacterium]|nr:glycosyltransferase family 39 protein [Nitrospiraceae bacterium]